MLRTKLILERLDKDHRVLERREQLSRSFTRGLMDLLYVQHAQLASGSGYNCTDVNKQLQQVDVYIASSADYRGRKTNLMLGAPPGSSSMVVGLCDPSGRADQVLSGCDVGIQVGLDNTAVTPTDARLVQRLAHGRRAPDGAPVLFDSYSLDDADMDIYGVNWRAQQFIPYISHRITSVKVKIWKTGAPPDLNVVIRGMGKGTGAYLHPGTVDIASGTIAAAGIPGASPGALTTCTFGTPADLYAGHRYFIVLYLVGGDGGNKVNWRKKGNATYQRAWASNADNLCYLSSSSDSGVSWSTWNPPDCFTFEEYGQSVGEFEYGGCELSGLTIADPNGQFTIRRYFENHCGSPRTVQEVGLHAVGHWKWSALNLASAMPFLIARDVVAPGIAVNDGELLRVTYVPQITV